MNKDYEDCDLCPAQDVNVVVNWLSIVMWGPPG